MNNHNTESKKAKGGKDKKDKGLERKSIADQTIQACLQFGVLVRSSTHDK